MRARDHVPIQLGYSACRMINPQDTGLKDAAGKDIVNIFGGVKWGWQLQRAP